MGGWQSAVAGFDPGLPPSLLGVTKISANCLPASVARRKPMSRLRTNWFLSGSCAVPALAGASSLTSTKTSARSESRTKSTLVLPSRTPIGRACFSQKLMAQPASAALILVTARSHGAKTCLADRFFDDPKDVREEHILGRLVHQGSAGMRNVIAQFEDDRHD